MTHRFDPGPRGFWRRLRDAGLVIIVIMGIALIGLALGLALGMRMI